MRRCFITNHTNPTNKATVARLFRVVSILAVVYVVFYVVAWIATTVLVHLANGEWISNEVIVGYSYLTYFLQFSLQMGTFACLLAAVKHLQPTNILLKTGSIVGVAGASLLFIVFIVSSVYSYFDHSTLYDPSFSETGWMKILLMICGNPISQTALPWIAPIGLIVCTVGFFAHSEKTVRTEAIALAAVVAVERIVRIIPMSSMVERSLSGVLNFAAAILTALLFASLTKYYKQA